MSNATSLLGEDWLEVDTSTESSGETVAAGGALSPAGRAAAIRSALPLLGLYFSSTTQPLEIQQAVGRSDTGESDDLTPLLAGIRLRVALASAAKLQGLLRRVLRRQTFRYELHRVDSTGAVTGQLDVNRYATRTEGVDEVQTYPILEVRRSQETAENVLAVYAIRWVSAELRAVAATGVAPAGSAEALACARMTNELDRALHLPGFASCLLPAQEVQSSRNERQLLNEVKRRLRRREVANPTPYTDLVTWIEDCLAGRPVASTGDLDWSFYGDRFDTKLFELWCLAELANEMSRQLAADLPIVNPRWRHGTPAYSWMRPAGDLHLHFQRSIPAVSAAHAGRWRTSEDVPLGGVPDLLVQAVRREDRVERLAVLDPKLRQRSGPPAEELYKILGYLENFGLTGDPTGAILYHTTSTGPQRSYRYTWGELGNLVAVALNPTDADATREALTPLVGVLLGLLGIPLLAADAESGRGDDADVVERQVRARTRELAALESTLPAQALEASRRRVQAMLGDARWARLTVPVQTMLATAEHVGFSLDSTADFSGPVIGVCASVEVLLHDQVIGPATAHDPRLRADCRTFGQAVHALRRAEVSSREPLDRAIRNRLATIGAQPDALHRLIPLLDAVNRRFRIPAAHRELVTDVTWRSAWTAIIGPDRVLALTIDALLTS